MANEKNTYQNWEGLLNYTKEFKEWIWKLFRKVHARIGHVEEELAKVRENTKVDYEIVHTFHEGNNIYILQQKNLPKPNTEK